MINIRRPGFRVKEDELADPAKVVVHARDPVFGLHEELAEDGERRRDLGV